MVIDKIRHGLESSVLALETEIARQTNLIDRDWSEVLKPTPVLMEKVAYYNEISAARFKSIVVYSDIVMTYDEEYGIIIKFKELESESQVNKRLSEVTERIKKIERALVFNKNKLVKTIEDLNNYNEGVKS